MPDQPVLGRGRGEKDRGAKQTDDADDGAEVDRLVGKLQRVAAQRIDHAAENRREQRRDDIPGAKICDSFVGAPGDQQDAADHQQGAEGDGQRDALAEEKDRDGALHSGTEARIGPLRAAPIFSMPI